MIVPALITACGGGGGSAGTTPTTPLSLQPNSATVGVGTTQKFAASGGQPPYNYSVASGTGTVDSAGLFTASDSAGAATVRVTDGAGASATAAVTINAALAMNARSITVTASSGQTFQFAGTGGSGTGYQYVLVSGNGTISPDGLYTAGNSVSRDTVQVRDSQGTTASSTVDVLRVRTNGPVNSIAASGSALYVAGAFSAVNPYLAPQMAVLDPTAGKPQLQCDLNSGFDAPVRKVLLVNNALYVGGDFSSYQGHAAHGLAKLDATTCALDTTFTQSGGFAGTSLNAYGDLVGPFQAIGATSVVTLAVSGSSLFVAGSFTSYRGLPAQNLAKLDLQTGALDQTFTAATGADGPLMSLALSADSLYVAGELSHYRGAAVAPFLPVKLDLNSGVLDPAFQTPGLSGLTTALVYSGTSLYAAGMVSVPSSASTVVKLNAATGARDTTFVAPLASPGQIIFCMAASGPSLFVGGGFTMSSGQTNFAKLDASTGQPDSAFIHAPSLDGEVFSFVISGSSVYLAGGLHGSQSGASILKLDLSTGAADSAFGLNPGFGGTPLAITAGANAIYVGGAFSGYGGSAAANIAKFDSSSGVPDKAFDMAAATDGAVNKILISGASMYLAGQFFRYAGVVSGFIAKADVNTGAPDTTFMQGGGFSIIPHGADFGSFGGSTVALALSGTSLYVAGRFTHYRNQSAADLVKIDATSGNLDLTFMQGGGFSPLMPNSQPFPDVNALAATQNALYVAGDFSQYRGVGVNPLLKLDLASGAVDSTFTALIGAPLVSSPLKTALIVSGNNLYVGGAGLSKLDATSGAVDTVFTQAVSLQPRGTAPGSLAVVSDVVLSGSAVYVAGDFALGAGSPGVIDLIKVDAASGALDTTFSQAGGPDGQVNAMLLEAGSLYIGGAFSTLRVQPARFSAALDPANGANQDVAPF